MPRRAISAGVGNFATKLVAMATSLEESEKLDRIDNIHTNTFHLVKKMLSLKILVSVAKHIA